MPLSSLCSWEADLLAERLGRLRAVLLDTRHTLNREHRDWRAWGLRDGVPRVPAMGPDVAEARQPRLHNRLSMEEALDPEDRETLSTVRTALLDRLEATLQRSAETQEEPPTPGASLRRSLSRI